MYFQGVRGVFKTRRNVRVKEKLYVAGTWQKS